MVATWKSAVEVGRECMIIFYTLCCFSLAYLRGCYLCVGLGIGVLICGGFGVFGKGGFGLGGWGT